MTLVKHEKSKDLEYRADSLVYKVCPHESLYPEVSFLLLFNDILAYVFQVFGLYFMQSYVGLFYHAILHRNIMTLRQVLFQRVIFSEVRELDIFTVHSFLFV